MRNGPPERKPLSLLPGGFGGRRALEIPLVPRRSRDRMPRGRLHTEAEKSCASRHREAAVLPLYAWPACENVDAPDRAIVMFALPVLERLRRIVRDLSLPEAVGSQYELRPLDRFRSRSRTFSVSAFPGWVVHVPRLHPEP